MILSNCPHLKQHSTSYFVNLRELSLLCLWYVNYCILLNDIVILIIFPPILFELDMLD